MPGVSLTEDRSIAVPAGHLIRTDYVRVERVRLACRERMAIGDVDRAYQRTLQLGASERWPCPIGEWETDAEDGARQFVIRDGRHQYVAALMMGKSHILVAWLEAPASAEAQPLPQPL
ncbi:MAG: hypothetical protein AB1941_09990 [Gemmatimonadota bacterium]